MTVPRSVATFIGEVEAVHFHLFAYSSILGCCAAAFAVVGQRAGMVKRLLRSKSRISKRKHFDSQTGAYKWSYGSEHGKESFHCSPVMARHVNHHSDGQYGSLVMDNPVGDRGCLWPTERR